MNTPQNIVMVSRNNSTTAIAASFDNQSTVSGMGRES